MMGWSGGTELFDRVVGAIVDSGLEDTSRIEGFEDETRECFIEIIDAFRDQDWDCLYESEYYGHPVIGPLLKIDEEDEDGS
jgi:hypothetical protein